MPRRDDLEYRALHLVEKIGNPGVLQSDLWRQLGASSREGSRIALKLNTKGLIRRERELFEGRWTYRLFPKREPISINSIAECPCLMCINHERCTAFGVISPQKCEHLTEWILGLTKTEQDPSPVKTSFA